MRTPILIGVISDTHGLLRPEALKALRGSQHIIHAGDVGEPEILEQLATIAPVTAVRGNVDKAAWARKLPETEVVEIGRDLDLRPARSCAARSQTGGRRIQGGGLRAQPRAQTGDA